MRQEWIFSGRLLHQVKDLWESVQSSTSNVRLKQGHTQHRLIRDKCPRSDLEISSKRIANRTGGGCASL